jgi:hypothetical protein
VDPLLCVRCGHNVQMTFTLREEGTKIRVVSARTMHRKERGAYEKQG